MEVQEELGSCLKIQNLQSPSSEGSTPKIAILKARGRPWTSQWPSSQRTLAQIRETDFPRPWEASCSTLPIHTRDPPHLTHHELSLLVDKSCFPHPCPPPRKLTRDMEGFTKKLYLLWAGNREVRLTGWEEVSLSELALVLPQDHPGAPTGLGKVPMIPAA